MRLAEFLHKITSRHVKLEGRNENLPESSFPDAVREAQVLLYFASRQGIQLEDTIIRKAVEGSHIAVGESQDIKAAQQIEQEFWPAFQKLAQAVKPATIESIKATHDSFSTGKRPRWLLFNQKTLSQRSVLKYSLFAIITLVALIAIQMYWVVGVSVTNETVSLAAEIERLVEEQRLRADEIGENTANDPIYNQLGGEIQQNEQWLVAAHISLEKWNRQWQAIDFFLFDSTASNTSDNPTVDARIAVTSAGFVLEALSTYVVPLLYGLLGAFAYVLREITKEVRAVTFSNASIIRYNLRLSLGLLAGITVGFLVSPDAARGAVQEAQPIPTLTTLGPMALAFLAGYSVELVFAVTDRIVSAFVDERIGAKAENRS